MSAVEMPSERKVSGVSNQRAEQSYFRWANDVNRGLWNPLSRMYSARCVLDPLLLPLSCYQKAAATLLIIDRYTQTGIAIEGTFCAAVNRS